VGHAGPVTTGSGCAGITTVSEAISLKPDESGLSAFSSAAIEAGTVNDSIPIDTAAAKVSFLIVITLPPYIKILPEKAFLDKVNLFNFVTVTLNI
jgi:hypothetical protein